MKMVQLSLALACLLAGADGFGSKPYETKPEFIVHKVGACSAAEGEVVWDDKVGNMPVNQLYTAAACWTACQKTSFNLEPRHMFRMEDEGGFMYTECVCMSGCACMNDAHRPAVTTLAPPDWKAPPDCEKR